jgi:hypothetical protein
MGAAPLWPYKKNDFGKQIGAGFASPVILVK